MKQRRKNDQIINSRERSPVLPLVNCLWGIETKNHLQVMNGQAGSLPEIHNVGTGQCQINRWNVQLKHLLFLNYQVPMDEKSRLSHTRQAAFVIQTGWYSDEFSASIRT